MFLKKWAYATVQTAAMRQARVGAASTIGISITSGGIGKNELSVKETNASSHSAGDRPSAKLFLR